LIGWFPSGDERRHDFVFEDLASRGQSTRDPGTLAGFGRGINDSVCIDCSDASAEVIGVSV
jgi:hypothetical protein